MILWLLSAICFLAGVGLWLWSQRKLGPPRGCDLKYDDWICAYAPRIEVLGTILTLLGAFGLIMKFLLQ